MQRMPNRQERRAPSARTRILGWYIVLLAVSLVAALFVQRAFLLAQVSAEIDESLDQEVAELGQLAQGTNPETGELFGDDAAAVFDLFLSRNVPLLGEAVVTLVDGQPYKSDVSGAELARGDLVDEWAAVTVPVRREVDLPSGRLRYVAVPLTYEGEIEGVFVVSIDVGRQFDRVEGGVRLAAIVYGSILLLASALAWIAAGGILRPIRDLNEAARSISETDLSRRIPVEGNDELAEVSRTFNSMLDRLEEAFSVQRRFVDDAGHELRTPITVIRGNLEVMGDDPGERAETVRLVTDELDRMSRIVDDLLLLANAEQPDFIQPHPLDLAEFVDEMAAKAAAFGGRSVTVDERSHAVITADRQRLVQAVLNLIRNAVEHTPADTPISVGSRLTDGSAHIWVTDRGPGISAGDQARLFERFARGANGRRVAGGAGLGLAIVKAIAEGHGGRVEVASIVGEGTTFTVAIPTEDPPTPEWVP
jgi:two-component system OmpR family sensor kinase